MDGPLGLSRQRPQAIPDNEGSTEPTSVDEGAALTPASRTESPVRPVIAFLWAFLGVGMMLCAWSFATPMGAAPDEPSHVVQATAIVRGQFDEPEHPTGIGPVATVNVPAWARNMIAPCFTKYRIVARALGHPNVTPACVETLGESKTIVAADTQFSNAPPLYYAVMGIPSLFFAGDSAVYAMRLVGDLVDAALVALGISLLLRYFPRRTVLIGFVIALSPMVLFLMAVVSSSGLEIASGFATWCGGLCVVKNPRVPRALAIWTAVAAILLALSRPTSPLDVAIIAIVLAFLVGWHGLQERLNPSLRPLWIPLVGVFLVAAIFLVIGGPPRLTGAPLAHPVSLLSNMRTSFGLTGARLRQLVGNFGWLDTPVPTWVVVVWATCLAGLTAAALFVSAPCRRALPVLAALILAMPLALESPQINRVGTYWQGRYWLPLAVGFPLVAASFTWRARRAGRPGHGPPAREWVVPTLTLCLGALLFAGQVASFQHALTRYEVGLGVPPKSPVVWLPPGGHLPVEVLFVVGALVTLAMVVVMMARQWESPRQSERVLSATLTSP
jgi:heme/copper-type cytochrome/quinol oxidase subunit 3